MTPKRVHSTMSKQDGVITLHQALDAGMTKAGVSRRVASGEWRRLTTGVYLRSDRPHSSAVRLRAGVYAAGERAVADGPSAAWWHGLIDRPPTRCHVTIPARRSVTRRAGVRIRRRDLEWTDVGTLRSLRCTDLPLTVLEAAVSLPRGSVLMDRALQRHTTLPVLLSVHERNLGRHGSAAAARLLQAAGEGGASEAERMLHRLLRGAGVAGWTPHLTSCGYEIDVAFVRERVAIEVDGWAWHRDVERFNHDLERQNVLVNTGWHVLRFSWHQLRYDPDTVLGQIVAALGRS
ncbi:DUF559 domain-containing protein [Rhodococcus spelaei]|uniref:DUF559 domain-containing protein n=1 Tax=Rhodococcus spelaei TaxID=2546320 RepID=A0A541BPD0_9NOCA|nr:type IV toxin-antitoxin system AbiEi family antitoxin domain-containing protein [Rhodococcus spelaei]TQF74170.1 DUF559 domain-containing protein [Rhodococcus spelaei]